MTKSDLPRATTLANDALPEASLAQGLVCAQCGWTTALSEQNACGRCFGPLHVQYDVGRRAGERPSQVLGARPAGLWRYRELLPPTRAPQVERLRLEASPLRRAERLGEAWGLKELWIKDDTVLPTGSFKDRPASVAVAFAADHGYPAVGCASTGNLAAATARAAARLGLPCPVLVPAGLPASKLLPVYAFGGQVVEVEGTYDDANRLANLLGEERRIGLVNVTLRPYYTEGSKTLGLETLDGFGWNAPDWLGIPLGSGALLSATFRGLEQVRQLGWLDGSTRDLPALFGSQPVGCAPIVEAFQRGTDRIVPVREPHTIAESLAIGDPASGAEAIQAIRATGGFADAPSSQEVLSAIHEAARWEGVWTEPAGGTVLATIRRKVEEGTIDRADRVVAFLTGAGWKVPQVLGDPAGWARPAPIRVRSRERKLGELLGIPAHAPSEATLAPARGLAAPPPVPAVSEGTW